jgi:hypothetical protein
LGTHSEFVGLRPLGLCGGQAVEDGLAYTVFSAFMVGLLAGRLEREKATEVLSS